MQPPGGMYGYERAVSMRAIAGSRQPSAASSGGTASFLAQPQPQPQPPHAGFAPPQAFAPTPAAAPAAGGSGIDHVAALLAPYNPAGAAPSVAGPQKHHERLLAQDTAARQNLEGASRPCVRA